MTSPTSPLEKKILYTRLFAFYGPFLTETQQKMVLMSLEEDCSLTEIASLFGVTKQSVHDTLSKAEKSMLEHENILHLYKNYAKQSTAICACLQKLESSSAKNCTEIQDVINRLHSILNDLEEDYGL